MKQYVHPVKDPLNIRKGDVVTVSADSFLKRNGSKCCVSTSRVHCKGIVKEKLYFFTTGTGGLHSENTGVLT